MRTGRLIRENQQDRESDVRCSSSNRHDELIRLIAECEALGLPIEPWQTMLDNEDDR